MRDQQRIEMIARALQAFVGAETWAESKRIVAEQAGLLLTDETDFVLTILLQQYAHDQEAQRNLEDHRELLQRCRAEGIEAAFAEHLRPATTSDIPAALMARLGAVRSQAELEQLLGEHPELLPVLMQMHNGVEEQAQVRLAPLMEALIDCDSPDAVLTLVAEQPDLLSDEMDTLLQQSISQARAQGDAEGDGMAQLVEQRHATLHQLRQMMRETGISAEAVVQALRGVQEMPADALEEAALLQSIQGFVTTSDWLEARSYVEEHPTLLSDEADKMLAKMIAEGEKLGEEDMVSHLQEHRKRLARARQDGLDAIAPLMPPEAQVLMGMLADLPDEVRNPLLALMANDPNPEALEELLDEHPQLLPVLMQIQNAGEENPQNAQPRLAPLMQALIDCDSPQAVLILVSQQPDLLSDEMDALLQQSISQARAQGDAEGDEMAQLVEERLTTLRQLRETMGDREIPANVLEQAALMQSIEGLVSTATWLEARFYVEAHPELLSDKADSMLAEMIAIAQREASKSMTRHLQRLRKRLARARRVGLDAIAPA